MFTFKPIYGFGWRCGRARTEVPDSFIVRVEGSGSSTVEGIIEGPHEYEGRKVSLSLRSAADGVKHFNVLIRAENNSEEVTGFAELVL